MFLLREILRSFLTLNDDCLIMFIYIFAFSPFFFSLIYMKTFADVGMTANFLEALRIKWYTHPTPIQEQAIPVVLEWKDVFGCAQTGTGKTAAFALPTLQRLDEMPRRRKHIPIRALVMTPTRELAIQIWENFDAYAFETNLTNTVIFWWVKQGKQVARIKQWVDVLVATPGRLLDLINQWYIKLGSVEIFILDEADRMLDMWFIHDVKRTIKHLPKQRQTLFFSATTTDKVKKLADTLLTKPVHISVTPPSSTVDTIEQSLYTTRKGDKRQLLLHVLETKEVRSAVVFTKTKHRANKIEKFLNQNNIKAAALHGNKSQTARQKALAALKNGSIKILVATDIAARGIDVDMLSHVIIYEVPMEPEVYVHRIWRTGRAGEAGEAVMFCEPEETKLLNAITKLIKKDVPHVVDHPFHLDIDFKSAADSAPRPRRSRNKTYRGRRNKRR